MRLVLLGAICGCADDLSGGGGSPAGAGARPAVAVLGGATCEGCPEGIVAHVGPIAIDASTVARIAAAQAIDPAAARDRAVYDALFAAAALEDLPARELGFDENRVLARALLHVLWRENEREPIGEAELGEAVARNWIDVDRPEGWRAVHVLVALGEPGKPPPANGATRGPEEARRLAERLRRAVEPVARDARARPARAFDDKTLFTHGVKPADDAIVAFETAVRAVDAGGLHLTVEPLSPCARDGRIIAYGATADDRYVDSFAAALTRLERRGDVSDVVETPFGYHVMLLLDRTPPKRLEPAQQLARLRPDILGRRAHARQLELLRQLAGERVHIAANADARMGEVRVDDLRVRREGAP